MHDDITPPPQDDMFRALTQYLRERDPAKQPRLWEPFAKLLHALPEEEQERSRSEDRSLQAFLLAMVAHDGVPLLSRAYTAYADAEPYPEPWVQTGFYEDNATHIFHCKMGTTQYQPVAVRYNGMYIPAQSALAVWGREYAYATETKDVAAPFAISAAKLDSDRRSWERDTDVLIDDALLPEYEASIAGLDAVADSGDESELTNEVKLSRIRIPALDRALVAQEAAGVPLDPRLLAANATAFLKGRLLDHNEHKEATEHQATGGVSIEELKVAAVDLITGSVPGDFADGTTDALSETEAGKLVSALQWSVATHSELLNDALSDLDGDDFRGLFTTALSLLRA